MREWTDEATWKELQGMFERFSAEDSWRALRATSSLYRCLAMEIAERLNLNYLERVDRRITDLVETL